MEAKKAVECCKWNLLGDSDGSSEDQNAIGLWTIKTEFMRFQRRRTLGNWTRGCLCSVLVKILSTYCPCPKTFCKANLKVMY